MEDRINRNAPGVPFTRRSAISRAAMAIGALSFGAFGAQAELRKEEISHTGESIHHETSYKASRKRVFAALTDPIQFDKITHLSDGMKTAPQAGAPTEIVAKAGSPFRLFGGQIVGWQVELVPDERIVQAWRVAAWDPGAYSIARFALTEHDGGTMIAFDHTGFPKGLAEHLAVGWKSHYWEPLDKYLG